MIKTIYKCDCCGKEWDSESKDQQICAVSFNVNFGCTTITNQFSDNIQHWCRTCVVKKGIHEPITDKDREVAPEKPLSFEEKFTTLLNEIGFYQEQ